MPVLTAAAILRSVALQRVSIVRLLNAVGHFVLEHRLVLSLFLLLLRFLLLHTSLHLKRFRVNLKASRLDGTPPWVVLWILLGFH